MQTIRRSLSIASSRIGLAGLAIDRSGDAGMISQEHQRRLHAELRSAARSLDRCTNYLQGRILYEVERLRGQDGNGVMGAREGGQPERP